MFNILSITYDINGTAFQLKGWKVGGFLYIWILKNVSSLWMLELLVTLHVLQCREFLVMICFWKLTPPPPINKVLAKDEQTKLSVVSSSSSSSVLITIIRDLLIVSDVDSSGVFGPSSLYMGCEVPGLSIRCRWSEDSSRCTIVSVPLKL